MVYLGEVNNVLPPVGSVNQLISPPVAVALNSNIPGPQFVAPVTLVIVGMGLIFANTVALLNETQPLNIAPT